MEKKSFLSKFKFSRVSKVDKLFFVQNLQVMIRSGFPMAEALNTLSEQTENKNFKTVILDIKHQVEGGIAFHESLKKYEYIFSEIFVNLIEAGEVSGKMEETLNQLLIQMKKSYALSKKIRNALMYPALIIITMIGVGIGMFLFVLPNLIKMYTESNFTLPLPTRITIWLVEFINNNILIITAISLTLIISFIFFISYEKTKIYWHYFLLKLPIVSKIIKKINLAKLCRVLNSLIESDIPIVQDFDIIAKTLNNRIYRTYLLSMKPNLRSGETIYSILKKRLDLFPPVVSQMINVGEQSGTLDHVTSELAEFYEDEVADTMANLTVILEPLIMLIVGTGVAFMAVSVIYPIYALVDQI